jgi:vacuolar-type H+-ATPase subunit C/Vma6
VAMLGSGSDVDRFCQASEPLATFMDYCTYGHMIDNVVLIVTGTLHERDVQVLLSVLPPPLMRVEFLQP